MLKFLDNRTHEKPPKSPKKYEPEMLYGISAEAPATFQTPHTIIHKSTYINPHLPFEEARKASLPHAKLKFQPQWTKKTNLQMIEEQKIISSQLMKNEPQHSPSSRYRQSYYHEFNKDTQSRFKITKGQFTEFIQKNNHYKSIGPLHGKERTQDKINVTKRSVWLKPDPTKLSFFSKNMSSHLNNTSTSKNSVDYNSYYNEMRNSIGSTHQFIKTNTSLTKNSNLISQKSRIRNNRQTTNHCFGKDLHDRKKKSPYHKKFELPKLNSEFVMGSLMLHKDKIQPGDKLVKEDNGMGNLDEFETQLWKKFK